MSRQKASAHTATRRLCQCSSATKVNTRRTTMPTTSTKAKNSTIWISTDTGLDSPELKALRMDSTTMPIMSSMRAALSSVVPVLVFSLPISFRVSTVMETEVAENTDPMKADLSRL